MVLFPPPFYFVFYISNRLSYIQNNFSYELARPIMGIIFLVYDNIYIRDSRLNRPESISLANYAKRAQTLKFVGGALYYWACANNCSWLASSVKQASSLELLYYIARLDLIGKAPLNGNIL